MADLITERMAELHRLNDGGEESPVPPTAAPAPTAPTPAPTEPPTAPAAPRVLSLDDAPPDDFLPNDIPPTLRKPTIRETVAALAEDRKAAIAQRDTIGKVKNDHESENVVLKNLLTLLIDKTQQPPPAPAPAEPARVESAEERIRRENLDAIMGADPALALGRVVEVARETIAPEIKGQTDPLDKRIASLEQSQYEQRVNAAYDRAGQLLGRDAKTWRSDGEIKRMSELVAAWQLPADDSQTYVRVSKWIDDLVAERTPKPIVVPTPAPIAPAPPVGSGEPAAPVETPKTTLSARDDATVARVAKIFGVDKAKADELATRVLNDRSRPRAAAR